MGQNEMILAENQRYSLDCYKTQLNNNVLVVGTSGAGKTRSIVTPNLLEASGSYIVSDPKGSLYDKYKDYLESKDYVVRKLDFTDPANSVHYNFFHYIHNTQDIVKISNMLMANDATIGKIEPYWDDSAKLLIQAVVGYLYECWNKEDQNLDNVLTLIDMLQSGGDLDRKTTPLDKLFKEYEENHADTFSVKQYHKFRVAPEKTLRCTIGVANAKLGVLGSSEVLEMTKVDDIDFDSIGQKKTALFVVVSDTDRTMDNLVNLFFTQAMNELCIYADKECADYRLPVPVRFILDDLLRWSILF